MYCRKCGELNSQDAKFCKKCGEALWSGGVEIEKPEGSERPEQNLKPRKRNWIIFAVIIILAVVVALFMGISKVQKEKRYDKQVEAGENYLEDEEYENAVACFNEAISIDPKQVEPYQELAKAYIGLEDHEKVKKTYDIVTAYIVDEYDKQGELPADSIDVYKDAIRYYNDRGDNENAQKLTEEIVDMVDNEEKENEIRELTQQSAMYQAYYDLLMEYQDTYGTAEKCVIEKYWKYLKGLCFAKLLDFDQDGQEELILAYADPGTYHEFIPQYVIEVWRYNNTELEKVFTGEGYGNDGGTRTLYISCVDNKYYIIEGAADAFEYDYIWGLEDNKFYQVKTLEGEYDVDALFTIDGDVVSLEEFEAETSKWWNASTTYGLSRDEEDEDRSLEELQKAIEQLSGEISENHEEETDNEKVTSQMYRDIYGPIVQDVCEEYSTDSGVYNVYSLYDIDKDGIKELLVEEGTCEADYMYQVYTIQNKKSVYLGETSGWHSAFYEDENGGTEKYIICVQGLMGVEDMYHISIVNGKVVTEYQSSRELEEDEVYYTNPYPIECTYVSDLSLLQ